MPDRRTMLAVLAAAMLAAAPAVARQTTPPEAEVFQPSALRADLDALYNGLREAHYDLYVHTPRSELDALYAETRAGIDRPLTRFEVAVRFQRLVAAARVAHARVDAPAEAFAAYREAGGAAFPLPLRIVDGRSYVAADYSGLDDIAPGDEILRLNGVPMPDWLARAGRHISADNAYMSHSLLEYEFPRLVWQVLGPVDRFDVALRKADGRMLELAVPARTRDEARAAAAAQEGLLELGYNRTARVLDNGVAYLRPGPFLNIEPGGDPWDFAAFHDFIDGAFQTFLASGAQDLLIDLRANPGGDNSFSDHMIAWFADERFRFASDFRIRVSPQTIASNAERLPGTPSQTPTVSERLAAAFAEAAPGDIVHFEIPWAEPRAARRYEGRVWVLIDRQTYSNAVSVAAIVQDYGFGTVLGEPTADLATTYGAMERFALPHTGISVGYPKAHIIRPNGDETAHGVMPDTLIETPIVQPVDDPVLQAAIALIGDPADASRE